MSKIRIGITGQSGFVGTNLFNELSKHPEKFECIPFEDRFFEDDTLLRNFVKQCDVIFHLAALVRSPQKGEVYDTNIRLGNQLVNAMLIEKVTPCVLFASSVQEYDETEYGWCKRETREQLARWAERHNTGFVGMIFPNLFGPQARPNSHSFIATFCYKLTHNEQPTVIVDNSVSLKYIKNLVDELISAACKVYEQRLVTTIKFQPDFTMKVSKVLALLSGFKESYIDNHQEPIIKSDAEKWLFDTFKSYIDYKL